MPDEEKVCQKLTRVSIPALDEILGVPFKVLDDGFVRVVDYMGSDAAVVQSARVSYGAGTKHISEDRGLINYLMRNRHTTPFEMAEIRLHVRVPMDCWRQWIRHRTANVNEYSTRYSIAIDEKQKTAPDVWRLQAGTNKQGSSGKLEVWPEGLPSIKSPPMYLDSTLRDKLIAGGPGDYLTWREKSIHDATEELYKERVELFNIAKEQARKDLPLSTYTEAYWKCDLHNLLHFLGLRMDSHAQEEIRNYATVIGEQIVAKWCPLSWDAFMVYNYNSTQLSQHENRLIFLLNREPQKVIEFARELGWMVADAKASEAAGKTVLKNNRERVEFEVKASELGYSLPWIDEKK